MKKLICFLVFVLILSALSSCALFRNIKSSEDSAGGGSATDNGSEASATQELLSSAPIAVIELSADPTSESSVQSSDSTEPPTESSTGDSLFEKVNRAIRKTNALKTYNAVILLETSIVSGGSYVRLSSESSDVKVVDKGSADEIIYQISKSGLSSFKTYVSGGMAYVETPAVKFRLSRAEAETKKYLQEHLSDALLMEIDEKILDGAKAERTDNGTLVTFSLTNRQFEEIYAPLSSATVDYSSFSNINFEIIVLDNGYVYSSRSSYDYLTSGLTTHVDYAISFINTDGTFPMTDVDISEYN